MDLTKSSEEFLSSGFLNLGTARDHKTTHLTEHVFYTNASLQRQLLIHFLCGYILMQTL